MNNWVLLVFALLTASMALRANASEANITLPIPSLESMEGNSQLTSLFQQRLDFQFQTLYESSLLPSEAIEIVGLQVRVGNFRPFTTNGQFVSDSFRIDLSSSMRNSSSFDEVFADNHGEDRVTVFDGPLSVFAPVGKTPNDFARAIMFETPFLLDGESGDSLIIHFFDFDAAGPGGGFIGDREVSQLASGTASALSSDPLASRATFFQQNDTLVLRLITAGDVTPVPEPAMPLLWAGLVCCNMLAARRRQ